MKLACAISKLGAVMVASVILTGCATPGARPPVANGEAREHGAENEGGQRKRSGLWAKQLYGPAEYPRLALASPLDARDVLVCYDEHYGNSPKVQRRAYWLFAYSAKANNRLKPQFVNPAACKQLNPVPLIDVAETKAPPAKGYAAFVNADSHSFHLWRDGQDVGFFDLPDYEAAPRTTVWRVGLTVAAVAAIVAYVGIACMAQAAQ